MSFISPQFGQTDPRWAKNLLGYNVDKNFNMGNYGCLVTAVANLRWQATREASVTPGAMNDYLKANKGFAPGGGLMYWSAVPAMGFVEDHGWTTSMVDLNAWLRDDPNFAILEVKLPTQHFVLGVAQGKIIDSLDGRLKSIGTYPFVRARRYRVAAGRGGAPTPPLPVKTGDDLIMTADQERQSYNIVLGRDPEGQVPSNRTAMQFILDARKELADQRNRAAAQLAAALGDAAEWREKYNALAASRIAAEPVAETPPVPTDPIIESLTDPKPFDTITASQRIHSVGSQGFGFFLKLKRAIHNTIFQDKI